MKILSIMKIPIFFMIDKTTTIMSRYLGFQIQLSPCLDLCVCPHRLSHYPTKRKSEKVWWFGHETMNECLSMDASILLAV